ncbi:MAG: EamA family transporter [Ignavibacteriales bacterium]
MRKENFRAYLAWVTVCILWGTTYLAIRIGVEELPPMLFAGFRWLLAGTLLVIYLKAKGYNLPDRRGFIDISIMGVLLLGLGNGLVVYGEKFVPSGLAALLITTVPFWIVGIEAFLPHGTRLNLKVLTGLIIGLLGVGVIFGSDLNALFDASYLTGIISLLIAVFFWALGTLYSKYKKVNVHPLMSAAVQMLVAGFFQSLLGAALGEFTGLHIGFHGALAFLYLVIFGSLFGYTSYIYAVTHLPVSFVSTYAYINPVIALILGWLVLGEKLDLTTILAAVIIFAGVAMVKRGTGRKKSTPEPERQETLS